VTNDCLQALSLRNHLVLIRSFAMLHLFITFSSSFERVLSIHCSAALDLGAGVEQPFDCFVIQNYQAMGSMLRSMDWTMEDKMVNGLFFCTTLTTRRRHRTSPVATGGGFGGLIPPKKSTKPPNRNMKHYKSVEILWNFQYQAPRTNVKTHHTNTKPS